MAECEGNCFRDLYLSRILCVGTSTRLVVRVCDQTGACHAEIHRRRVAGLSGVTDSVICVSLFVLLAFPFSPVLSCLILAFYGPDNVSIILAFRPLPRRVYCRFDSRFCRMSTVISPRSVAVNLRFLVLFDCVFTVLVAHQGDIARTPCSFGIFLPPIPS